MITFLIVIQIKVIEIVEGQLFQFHEGTEKHKDRMRTGDTASCQPRFTFKYHENNSFQSRLCYNTKLHRWTSPELSQETLHFSLCSYISNMGMEKFWTKY